jgi:hypothetical protein
MKIISRINSPVITTGGYICNNMIFTTRADAIIATLLKPGHIDFYFHDEIFSNYNWSAELQETLPELYRQRAHQLREKYDYLILCFSGGYDSNEILHTFLEENIHLDEIQVYNYEKLTKRLDHNILEKDKITSSFVEYERAVIPALQYVKLKSPSTKINIIDVSDMLINDVKSDKHTIINSENLSTSSVIIPVTPRIYPSVIAEINTRISKNAGVISGNDKPKLIFIDNKMYFAFNDVAGNSGRFINSGSAGNYTPEWFYWSKDAPLIPIKQCQILLKVFRTNRVLLNEYVYLKNTYPGQAREENIIVPYIYQYQNKISYHGIKALDISAEYYLLAKHHGYGDNVVTPYLHQVKYLTNKFKMVPERLLTKPIQSKKYFVGLLK